MQSPFKILWLHHDNNATKPTWKLEGGIEVIFQPFLWLTTAPKKTENIHYIVCDVRGKDKALAEYLAVMKTYGNEIPFLVLLNDDTISHFAAWMQAGAEQVVPASALSSVEDVLNRAFECFKKKCVFDNVAKKLEELDEQFEALFESFPDPIMIHNFETIKHVNKAFVEQFAYDDKASIIGKEPLGIIHPEDLQIALDNRNREDFTGTTFVPQIRLLREDGGVVWCEVRISWLLLEGLPHLQVTMRDIGKRLKNEMTIRDSQESLEFAQRLAKIGSWEFNVETGEFTPSKECYRLFDIEEGISDDLFYPTCRSKIHPDDLDQYNEVLSDTVRYGTAFTFEYRVIGSDGAIKYLLSKGEPIVDKSDKVVLIKGACQDITERKLMQTKLTAQKQNNLLLKHSEQVPGVIYQFQISPNGQVSFPFVSEGVRLLYETTPEEIMEKGSRIFDYIHEDDVERFMESVMISKETMNNWTLDYRVRLPKKGVRWLRGNSKPVKLEDGSILWHGYTTDITDDKNAEEALVDSEAQVRTILAYAPSAIIALDMHGHITQWNTKAAMIFGWKEKDVLGKLLYEVIAPERNHIRYENSITSFRESKNGIPLNQTLEVKAIRQNQEEFPIALTVSQMTLKGQEYFISFIRDITKRRQADERIKQSLREKEVLLKEIHHRVKNNMQVITSLLSLQASFLDDDEIKDAFRSSQYRINSMGMVHEMLYQSEDISKIDYGSYLERLIMGLISAMKGYNSGIELNLDVPNISLNVDTAVPLGLIVNEVITNALKYGFPNQEEGIITVKITCLELPFYKLEIGDNGVGFEQDLDFKSSKSLGLMLIHKLATQLNGSIERLPDKKGTNYILYFQEIEQF